MNKYIIKKFKITINGQHVSSSIIKIDKHISYIKDVKLTFEDIPQQNNHSTNTRNIEEILKYNWRNSYSKINQNKINGYF